MKILEGILKVMPKIKIMPKRLERQDIQVFCQHCNEDITGKDGIVRDFALYCNDCLTLSLSNEGIKSEFNQPSIDSDIEHTYEIYNSKEVQSAIRNRELTNYKELVTS